jgi:hypothetical protein
MSDLLRDVGRGLSVIGGDWTKYSVLGSFVLYVFGYLAVRFHLSVIGVGTDLAVLDERYLFAGARFLVFLLSSIPSLLLVLLLPLLLLLVVFKIRPTAAAGLRGLPDHRPLLVAIAGIVVATAMIQFVMRQCFLLANLLLAPALPADPRWLVRLLYDPPLMTLYFMWLVLMTGVSIAVLLTLRRAPATGFVGKARGLLVFLTLVQILLLPINYGVLIMDKAMPRVATLTGDPLPPEETGWLVWEGRDGVTFLVRRTGGQRVLQTFPRADVKRTEIVAFDPIVPALFEPPAVQDDE